MSGFNYNGAPQNQHIYPQLYNPANAPPPGQHMPPAAMGYPGAPGVPQYPYQPQPGFVYPHPNQPGQPGHPPAAMSYPGMMTPATAPSYPGYPVVTPTPVAAVEWVQTTSRNAAALNERALVAGYEGHDNSPLWVIRARFQSDLIPGKLAIKHYAAYVAWGGNEHSVQNIEVCCARPERVRWVNATGGTVPPNAIPGGNTADGETLYIGRAREQGSLTPGKVHPSHKSMYISFAGKEVAHKNYEILCTV